MADFIKIPEQNLAKSMPALMSINMDNVKVTSPYAEGLMKAVEFTGKIREQAQKIKQNTSKVELESKFSDLDYAFSLKYESNPNIFSTQEGRDEITKAYNEVIEQKKQLYGDFESKFTPSQRAELLSSLKNNTQKKLLNLQKTVNNGYIKETTDNVLLSTKKSLISIPYLDAEDQEKAIGNNITLMNNLKNIGVNTDNMIFDYVVNAQESITQKMVKNDIIDNNTNPRFFKTTDNGVANEDLNNVIRDSQGNPIIDIPKKRQALLSVENNLLSENNIRSTAKSISESTGIPEDECYYIIKQTRADNMGKIRQASESNLREAEIYNKQQEDKLQQQIVNKQKKAISEYEQNVYNGDIGSIMNSINPSTLGHNIPTNYYMPMKLNNKITDTCTALYGIDLKTMRDKTNRFVLMMNSKDAQKIASLIKSDKEGKLDTISLDDFSKTMESTLKNDSGQYYNDEIQDMIYNQIAYESDNKLTKRPVFVKSMIGKYEDSLNYLNKTDSLTILNADFRIKAPKTDIIGNYKESDLFVPIGTANSEEINTYMYKYLVYNGVKHSNIFKGIDYNNPPSVNTINDKYRKLPDDKKIEIKNILFKLQNTLSSERREPAKYNDITAKNIIMNYAKDEIINLQAGTIYKKNPQKLEELQQKKESTNNVINIEQSTVSATSTMDMNENLIISNDDWINLVGTYAFDYDSLEEEFENRKETLTEEQKRNLNYKIPMMYKGLLQY